MKTSLFYFSATGNCLAVAKDIAAKLPGTEIYSIPKVIHRDIDGNADNIGLIFPVYFAGMPRIIVDFIGQLQFNQRKYLFAVCTCGVFPLGTLLQTQKQLQKKGLILDAGFSIPMPGNYIVKYGAFPVRKQKAMFAKEKAKIETVVKMIAGQQSGIIERNFSFINKIGDSIYQKIFPAFPTRDQNFTVSEKCNHCGICEKVCPVQNINMVDGKPEWQGNCEHCLACIQWCSEEAIQYGTLTLHRKRYHHPDVRVNELFII